MSMSQFNPRAKRVYGEVREEARKQFKEWRPGGTKMPWSRFGKIAAKLAVVAFLFGAVLFWWISRDLPDPNKLQERQISESTKLYDRTGTHLLYEVFQDKKRTLVDLKDISVYAVKATMAIEDKDFYNHGGIQLKSILRATFNNLIRRKTGSGGASTLTQQFIKITMVGDEHSIFRKVKEAILAIQLEKKYSKDEILRMYLNEVPYGSTNYGIEAASQSYFRKSAKDLTVAEGATLASMIQAPSRYLNNLDSLRVRRDYTIGLMKDQGYITEDQKVEAQNSALRLYRSGGIFDAPHFVLYVRQLLADQFGENLVDTGGLRVITSLDYDKQKIAERVVKENGDKFSKDANANNAALVALDPKTGQILAMVGSRDFENEEIDGQFNIITQGKLQPGSSFKPFVYSLAFQKGYTPDTVLYDVETNFDSRDGQKYAPKNANKKEYGLVTFRKALQGSLNIPAVKVLYLAGEKDTLEFAKKFGYTTFEGKDCGLSLVVGGCEVNPLEHTNGYATLANNGVYHEPVSIIKVENKDGASLFEWKEKEGIEAVSPEVAATITNVLSDDNARAYIFAPHGNLTLPDRQVAAKTGTTQNSWDAWILGYVPSLAAGVWVGNTPKHLPMKGGGNLLAGLIWHQFMKESLASTTPEEFPIAPANTSTKPILRGSDGGIKLRINNVTGKIAASTTPDNLITEKTYLPPHDILYYVDRDDPTGPEPINPAADPQYQNWEDSLQSWIARQQAAGTPVTLEDPPTVYDSPQALELVPNLEIVSPQAGQVFDSRQINFEIKASAPRGVALVTYYVDGQLATAVRDFPFSANYYMAKLTTSTHILKVVAQDDMGNNAVKEVNFSVTAATDPASFEWDDSSPLAVKATDYPRPFSLTPYLWDDITDIKIYLKTNGKEKLIYTFNHTEDSLVGTKLMFTWKKSPGVGNYELRGVMKDKIGRTEEKILEVGVE